MATTATEAKARPRRRTCPHTPFAPRTLYGARGTSPLDAGCSAYRSAGGRGWGCTSPTRLRAGSGVSHQRTFVRKQRRGEDSDDSDSDDKERARAEARNRASQGGPRFGYSAGEEDAGWGGDEPVEVFEGHTDVVKEFVWRRGGDGTAFQLITWSKDRTLRFWPVHPDTLAKVGYVRPSEPLPESSPTPATKVLANALLSSSPVETSTPKKDEKRTPPAPTFSFRNPPPPESLDASISSGSALGLTSPHIPALSAPIRARDPRGRACGCPCRRCEARFRQGWPP